MNNPLQSFDIIARNIDLARKEMPPGQKSVHWDVFPKDYDKAFQNHEIWPVFLRNALSIGFNDDFVTLCEGGNLPPYDANSLWHLRLDHDYRSLLPPKITADHQLQIIHKVFEVVIEICGADFVLENLTPPVGSPSLADITFHHPIATERNVVQVNLHDLILIYYAWQINRVIRHHYLNGVMNIVEIGSGFGGLAAKLKDLNPAAKIILLDLPEVTGVQTYYLQQRFPKCNFKFFEDLKERGDCIFSDHNVDFIILPGWAIENIPKNSIELVINTRSMMEMTMPTIDYYFKHIHRITASKGVFACFNRYLKNPGSICIKNFPFDKKWKILLSQSSVLQSHIHEMIVQRTALAQKFTVSQAMGSLVPF